MPRQAQCPKSYTHGYHGNTHSLYQKLAGTMNTRAVWCTECVAVYVYHADKIEVYVLDPSTGIPLLGSKKEA